MPLKWLIFAAVTFLVLFPYPERFAEHVRHLRNLEAMVQPDAPELAAWDDELRGRLVKEAGLAGATSRPVGELLRAIPAERVQKCVERFVLDKVQYAWDWDVWGMADYMPTVGEMFAEPGRTRGAPIREDCDGRAVMAASLMRRLGYDSHIVTDLRHMWVTTPQGEWMGPGGAKAMVSTSQGNRIAPENVLSDAGVSLSYGIAVFPLGRELVILCAAYVLSLCRRISRGAAALGALLLLQSLLFMRCGVLAPVGAPGFSDSWPAWVGIAHALAGLLVLWVASHRARRPRAAALPESGPGAPAAPEPLGR